MGRSCACTLIDLWYRRMELSYPVRPSQPFNFRPQIGSNNSWRIVSFLFFLL